MHSKIKTEKSIKEALSTLFNVLIINFTRNGKNLQSLTSDGYPWKSNHWGLFFLQVASLKTNDGYMSSILQMAQKITADLLYSIVMIISSDHQIQWKTIGSI